jgi:hydroxymethylbilane synthase
MQNVLIIGTRGSALALCQAGMIREAIGTAFPGAAIRLRKIKTSGDKITDVPLAKVGGKGLFVKEIEEALFRKDIDMAVHSMKDVPTILPEGLHLKAITRREDPRDIVISRNGKRLLDMPPGARIGTSSLRRQSQIQHLRSDFIIVPLRGNLDTRIRKLRSEGLDAIVLAAAGILRMGWGDQITEYLAPELCLPAIGQGALGLECRSSDERVNAMLAGFEDPVTSRCVRAERAFLKRLEGGCQVPIAAHAQIRNEKRLVLEGLVGRVDGSRLIRDGVAGDPDRPEDLGLDLAERLLAQGADAILREIYQ